MLAIRHNLSSTVLYQSLFVAALVMRVAACAPSSAGIDAASGTNASSDLRGAGPIHPVLNSKVCLDVAGGSEANGTLVQMANCSGNKAQAWLVSGTQVRVFADKCLSVVGGQAADGAHLQIWDCNAQDVAQSFFCQQHGACLQR